MNSAKLIDSIERARNRALNAGDFSLAESMNRIYLRVKARSPTIDALDSMGLPGVFYERLLSLRGGCTCGNDVLEEPARRDAVPCSTCKNPMTDDEASKVLSGFAHQLPRAQLLEWQTALLEHDYDATIDVKV